MTYLVIYSLPATSITTSYYLLPTYLAVTYYLPVLSIVIAVNIEGRLPLITTRDTSIIYTTGLVFS